VKQTDYCFEDKLPVNDGNVIKYNGILIEDLDFDMLLSLTRDISKDLSYIKTKRWWQWW
jgi:hypothetical protein